MILSSFSGNELSFSIGCKETDGALARETSSEGVISGSAVLASFSEDAMLVLASVEPVFPGVDISEGDDLSELKE